jgi:hypothetical protein
MLLDTWALTGPFGADMDIVVKMGQRLLAQKQRLPAYARTTAAPVFLSLVSEKVTKM